MKLPKNEIKKIAILRALQLGDMLCAIPAVRALKNAFPNAEITLLGLPWAAQFVKRFNKYFNSFIHFPGYPGLPEQEYSQTAFIRFTEAVAGEHFDLVIQMQGNGNIVNELLPLLDTRYMAGYYNDNSYIPTGVFMPYPNYGHEVERHIKLMQFLGVPDAGNGLEFPLSSADQAAFDTICPALPPTKYVCIHPGSRALWRQWPPKYFAALGDICVQSGFTVVVTGTMEECNITAEMIKCMHYPVVDFTGCTNLGAAALLIKNAFMLIANCTGVSHIAAAVKTRSIIISMDGEPERWGPLDTTLHTTIDCKDGHHFADVLAVTAQEVGRFQQSGQIRA